MNKRKEADPIVPPWIEAVKEKYGAPIMPISSARLVDGRGAWRIECRFGEDEMGMHGSALRLFEPIASGLKRALTNLNMVVAIDRILLRSARCA